MEIKLSEQPWMERALDTALRYRWFMLGGLALGAGLFWAAQVYEERQLQQRQEDAQLYYAYLEAVQAQEMPHAEELLRQLEQQSPSLYKNLADFALAQQHQGDFERALGYLHEIVAQADEARMRDLARLRMAHLYAQHAKGEEALALLDDCESTDFSMQAYTLKGLIAQDAQDYEQALVCFERAWQEYALHFSGRDGFFKEFLSLKLSQVRAHIS